MKKFFITVLLATLLLTSCEIFQKRNPAEDFYIPDGYVGWVRVEYEVKNAPPIPVENGRRIYKFDESGIIKTSSPQLFGQVFQNFYYYTADGTKKKLPETFKGGGGMIWGGHNSPTVDNFFVGEEIQYQLAEGSGCNPERDYWSNPLPKNIRECMENYQKEREKKFNLNSNNTH